MNEHPRRCQATAIRLDRSRADESSRPAVGTQGKVDRGRMSETARRILEAALKLPVEEREQLVDELQASLQRWFATNAIEQAWASEIERRSAEIDSGEAVLREWDKVRDEILAELRGGT
jgi:putative addiction module component (TIGR02574 family)